MINYRMTDKKYIAELIESDLKKDLHIHTCYSDGTLRPEQVVDRWKSEGYEIIAITDHDGIKGSLIGMEYAEKAGITFIPGIEFDSEDELGKDLHILGYGFDYTDHDLKVKLTDILIKRAQRNDRMMNALNAKGYGITLDDIGEINDGRYVGKPTFAKILQKKGFVEKPQDAFETIFREPELKCIKKSTLPSKEVIDTIHAAGGLAVMAHPMEQRHLEESYAEFEPRLFKILDRMVEYGIDGIECWHPSADEVQSGILAEYADAHGLIKSKGSDFHTDDKPRTFERYHRP